MKSKQYWERRAAERMVNYHDDAERTAREIGKSYYKAQEHLKGEIDGIFRGFRRAFALSEEEARRILDPPNTKTAMVIFRDAAMQIEDAGERGKALAALSSPAYQHRINRIDAVNKDITATCNSLYRTELKADTSFLSAEIVKAYENTVFDVQKGTGISGAFDVIPQSKIDAIMSRNWSGKHYSKRIWNNTDKLADDLKSDLMVGFFAGKSEQQMAKEISDRCQTGFFNARRLVRTECTYVTGQAELQSYRDMGAEEYEFSAVLDKHTSDICRGLDGHKYKLSEAVPGTNYPPMHPLCRSVANAVLPSEEELDEVWGDTADAIGADVDFDEWVKNLEKTPDGKWKYQKPLDNSAELDRKTAGKEALPESDSTLNSAEESANSAEENPLKMLTGEENDDIIKSDDIKGNNQADSNLYPDTLAGVKRGEAMSFEEADTGNVNPHYGEKGFDKNCQSCTIVYEARRRGFDVETLPCLPGSMAERLANQYTLAWIDPKTGKRPDFIKDNTKDSPKKYLDYMKKTIKPNERYILGFSWKGKGNSGHIVNLDLNPNGELRIKDNQRGMHERSEYVGDKAVLGYLKQMKWSESFSGYKMPKVPKMLRIDNLQFEPDVAKKIMKGRVK